MTPPRKKRRDEDTPPPKPKAPFFPGAITQPKTAAEAGAIRALFPFMSPEDARALAAYYNIKLRGAAAAPVPGTNIPTNVRNTYLSQGRASQALNAVRAMRAGLKPGENTPGLAFLERAVGLLAKYGGTNAINGMSRQQFTEFNAAIDGLFDLAKGKESITPFAQLASTFLRPSFSAGPLMDVRKVGGRNIFGVINPKLFS